MSQLDAFMAALAQATTLPDATNQYADDGTPGNAARRANLRLALELALQRGPDMLLVGEAPGHLGARRTGVPFTSECLLLEGIAPLGLFGAEQGFVKATSDEHPSREQTATFVYRELHALNRTAAGWNAYPFHPHRLDNPHSNRTPRVSEIRAGQPFLTQVHALFPGVPVVAMGNVADRALTMLDIPHIKVRHPAQGGARIFAAGMQAAFGGDNERGDNA